MGSDLGVPSFVERRNKPRFKCNYAAVVQGQGNNGQKFKEEGRVVSLSRSGVFMLLNQSIPESNEISVRIALPTGTLEFGTSRLAIKGIVVRSENLPGGFFGVAIKFDHYKIL